MPNLNMQWMNLEHYVLVMQIAAGDDMNGLEDPSPDHMHVAYVKGMEDHLREHWPCTMASGCCLSWKYQLHK